MLTTCQSITTWLILNDHKRQLKGNELNTKTNTQKYCIQNGFPNSQTNVNVLNLTISHQFSSRIEFRFKSHYVVINNKKTFALESKLRRLFLPSFCDLNKVS